MKSKDLQGLRGIAVIVVVLYHLKVKYVERGFLGVDIRLLPSYALVLCFIVLVMPFFLILKEIDIAYWELKHSLAFTINFKFGAETVSYFRKDIFFASVVMHLWSLALEMQFYLFVPFIYMVLNRFNERRARIAVILSILTGSLLSYCVESNDQHRFYHLHNRLWQFVCGFVAHEIALEFHSNRKWLLITSSICSLLLLCFFNGRLPLLTDNVGVLRVLTCFLTSLIVLCSNFSENPLLATRGLVYMGDISYVLYLIHWPVIVFDHMISVTQLLYYILIVLAISLVLSVLIHHLFEKPLLTKAF
ncbi:hypothetical protein PFISCL1PPCAC_14325, partial [Pristionchus fissidentatus]